MEETINEIQIKYTWETLEELSGELKHILLGKLSDITNVFKRYFREELIEFKLNFDLDDLVEKIKIIPRAEICKNILIERILLGYENLSDTQEKVFNWAIRNIYHLVFPIRFLKITIRFPKTTVTNEKGCSVDVFDLFCRITIDSEGNIYEEPKYNRTTYQEIQWASEYMHSHITRVSRYNPNEWKSFCYGSGPLRDIISRLNCNDNTEIDWMQFCMELKRSVEVESLEGVPYNYIEKIQYPTNRKTINDEFKLYDGVKSLRKRLLNILIYILENNMIRFKYKHGRYEIGMSPFEFRYVITKAIHKLWQEDKQYFDCKDTKWDDYKQELLESYTVNNKGELMLCGDGFQETESIDKDGMYMFDFKGEPIYLKIILDSNKEDKSILLVKDVIAKRLQFNILYLINSNYGKNNKRTYSNPYKELITEPQRNKSWV